MKLPAPIEEPGFFWTPDDPERKFPGILKISESGDIILKITSLSSINPGKRRFGDPLPGSLMVFDRIIGVIQRSPVTLEDCREIGMNINLSVGIATISVAADTAFIGVGYGENASITFSELSFSIEGLDEWLSISGSQSTLKFEGNRIHEVTIESSLPEKIIVDLPDDEMKLIFEISLAFPLAPGITETKITQKAHMVLESKELRSIDDFLEVAYKMIFFLRFAIGRTISIISATGYSRDLVRGKENHKIPVEIFFESDSTLERNVEIDRNNMLLNYRSIQDRIQDVIVNWSKGYQKFKPAFDLYFAYEAGAYKNLEGQFLTLVQGLEAIHRRYSQDKIMPDDDFEGIKRKVLSVIPKSRQSWMKSRIRYANELPMRKRLTRIIEPFRDFYGSRREQDSFINSVVDMRNRLIHSDPDLSKSAPNIEKMYVLCMKLQSLYQLHILKILGMNEKRIEEIVRKNRVLRGNLELSERDISVY